MRKWLTLGAIAVFLIPFGSGCNKTKEGKNFAVTEPGDLTLQVQGDQKQVEVAVERKNKFDGKLTATIELPSGVKAEQNTVTIGKKAKAAKFMLTATDDAKIADNQTATVTVAAGDEKIPVKFKISIKSAGTAVTWQQKAEKVQKDLKAGIAKIDQKRKEIQKSLADATEDERKALNESLKTLDAKRKEMQAHLTKFGETAAEWTEKRYNEVAANVEKGLDNFSSWWKKTFESND